MIRTWLLSCAAASILATTAAAQLTLEWKLTPGAAFQAERIYAQKQTVEVKNKVLADTRTKTFVITVTVKEKTAGGFGLDLKLDSVQFKSAGAGLAGGLDDKLAAKMTGSTFSATMTPQGRLTKLQGYDAFMQKVADKKDELEKVLRALLPEEAVRADMEDIFHFLPDRPVRAGDSWKREAVEPVPPFGSFKSAITYVLDGDKTDAAAISYTIKMTYKRPTTSGDLFNVVSGTLKADDGKGSIVFDTRTGCLVQSEKTVNLRGSLVIESMGKQTPMEFTSTNSVTVRFSPRSDVK